MHGAAYLWVKDHAPDEPGHVLDIGGRNVNGSPRSCFPGALSYTTLDIADGKGVDIVANAARWQPDRQYDTIVCCEVFEHTAEWPAIVVTIRKALAPGGMAILTMAGPGRVPHSGIDGNAVRDGEYYGNVDPERLTVALYEQRFEMVHVDVSGADVRAVCW